MTQIGFRYSCLALLDDERSDKTRRKLQILKLTEYSVGSVRGFGSPSGRISRAGKRGKRSEAAWALEIAGVACHCSLKVIELDEKR